MSIESGSSRAAVKIGSAILRIVASISASRMTVAAAAGDASSAQQCRREQPPAAGQIPVLSLHLPSPFIDRDAIAT